MNFYNDEMTNTHFLVFIKIAFNECKYDVKSMHYRNGKYIGQHRRGILDGTAILVLSTLALIWGQLLMAKYLIK